MQCSLVEHMPRDLRSAFQLKNNGLRSICDGKQVSIRVPCESKKVVWVWRHCPTLDALQLRLKCPNLNIVLCTINEYGYMSTVFA